jgi:hypothetical protein
MKFTKYIAKCRLNTAYWPFEARRESVRKGIRNVGAKRKSKKPTYMTSTSKKTRVFIKGKSKAVPLHATEAIGGEEV